MLIPNKQLKNGFSMPAFGLGTWKMGGDRNRDPDNDDAADITAIRTAIELGVTHIDTAELYGDGKAEELISEAVQGYDRSKLFIISKVKWTNLAYDEILSACEKSLQRLRMDYLDMYVLHSYSEEVPLEESMRALDALVDRGLVRSIGVCNFGVRHLAEAQKLAKHPVVYDQVHYNLEFREPERAGLLEYCQKNDVLLAAWRPVRSFSSAVQVPEILEKMCQKYGKTPAQIAINWLVSQENVVTLSKTRNIDHLKENIEAVGWNMSADDIELLRREYPDQKDVSDAVPLE